MTKTSIFVYFNNVDGFVYMLFTNSQNFNPGCTLGFEKKAFEMSSFQSSLQGSPSLS